MNLKKLLLTIGLSLSFGTIIQGSSIPPSVSVSKGVTFLENGEAIFDEEAQSIPNDSENNNDEGVIFHEDSSLPVFPAAHVNILEGDSKKAQEPFVLPPLSTLKRSQSSDKYRSSDECGLLSSAQLSYENTIKALAKASAIHIKNSTLSLTSPAQDDKIVSQGVTAFSAFGAVQKNNNFFSSCSSSSSAIAPFKYDYNSWVDACNKLPSFTHIGSSWKNTALNWAEFNAVLQQFITVNQVWYRDRAALWVTNKQSNSFLNAPHALPPRFEPFVQKLIVNPDVKIALRGDLHGDIHSLMAYLNFLHKEGHLDGFDIKDKNKFHMIFLGDYVDRGNYGVEVLYTLMRLKIANPDNVTLVRGNHEDTSLCNTGGFKEEFNAKFGNSFENYQNTVKMYDFLPVALYLGSGSGERKDFMQCCHGGMEIGYNPSEILDSPSPIAFSWFSSVNRLSEFKALDLKTNGLATQDQKDFFARSRGLENKNIISYYDVGFMWSDFQVKEDGLALITTSHRGAGIYEYSKVLTHAMLHHINHTSKHTVRGVLRAHQHVNFMDPMMKSILDPHNETCHKGVSKLWKDPKYKNNKDAEPEVWDGMVCTFLIAPDSSYSCKGTHAYSSSVCQCEIKNSLNGCKDKMPTKDAPCKGALFDFDAFAIMTTADTYDQWKFKVHRNMLQDIIPKKVMDTETSSTTALSIN